MTGSPIDSLDRRSVLAAAVERRRIADAAEAELLAVAAHFADLHPAVPGGERAGYGDPALRISDGAGGDLGGERFGPLAGSGAPEVAEFAPEELAVALGISGDAGKRLVGEALELRHRLPRLWALVHEGRLQAWKARAVAVETIPLSPASASFVDRHVSVVARRNRIPGPGQLHRLVHEALLRCDPDVAAGREQAALDRRGVWSDHRESTATTTVTIVADTPDAVAFEHTVGQVALGLGALGDLDPLDVRRARAVGILADPQKSLDLLAGRGPDSSTGSGHRGLDRLDHRGGLDHRGLDKLDHRGGLDHRGLDKLDHRRGGGAVLYLHLDVDVDAAGAMDGVGTVERYGALTAELMRTWLAGADHVTVRPVLEVGRRREAAAGYTPPPLMREEVILRDPTCVFPHCTRTSRSCDLDHITGYQDGLDPSTGSGHRGLDHRDGRDHRGETHPDNLAPLCRRHHRLKTHGRWRYRRDPDGSYTWTTPTGQTWTVAHHGTRHPAPISAG